MRYELYVDGRLYIGGCVNSSLYLTVADFRVESIK